MKKQVVNILEKAIKELGVKMSGEEIEKLIETPPSSELGDYAFPCFVLAKQLKMAPHEIALEIRKNIKTPHFTDFDDIQTNGPYLNFFVDRKDLARRIVWEAIGQKKSYGKSKIGKGKKILIEFSSPNIAKPFGIGHLRSTIIGNSIANISEFLGYKTIRLNYLGDWGTQFGKILLGYEKFGNESKLLKDPINHLLSVYVRANKKQYEEEARQWFKRLEDGDRKAMMLWKIFRNLSLKEFEKTYKDLGIEFDVYSGESQYNKEIKLVIEELNKNGMLKKSKGAMGVGLSEYGLGFALIKKSDGTTIYLTRDIAAAISRYKKYKFSKMIYEVGQEQILHFKQLFKILELMGYKWSKDCVHVDHGFYLSKLGKKFATRKGKTVFMKDILEETKKFAKKEIQKRDKKIKKDALEERAHKIAIAAIFYGDLKNYRKSNIAFDIKKFVSFEGDTGPYILYSYARAGSILKKSTNKAKFEIYDLDKKETDLVQKLSQFQETVVKAFNNMSPSVIANYSYDISKSFNEFYHSCPVIGSKEEPFRLALVEAFRIILRNSLGLLGIKTIEEM